jgi:hypothetical protein
MCNNKNVDRLMPGTAAGCIDADQYCRHSRRLRYQRLIERANPWGIDLRGFLGIDAAVPPRYDN